MANLIYILDDSKIIREIVSQVFANKNGNKVKAFATGEELFKELGNEVPDLLILDYYLDMEDKNAMNGYEILKQLHAQHRDVKTIVLSGLNDEIKINELKQFGIVDFVNKDAEDIFTLIEELAAKHLSESGN